jgi:hypothetical protein
MTRRQRIGNDSRQATEVGTSGGVVGRGGHRTRSATPRTIAHHDRSRLEPNGCEDPSSRAGMLCLLVLTQEVRRLLPSPPRHQRRPRRGRTHAVETAPQPLLQPKRKGPQLPAVSPALARSVWEGMSNPSTRRVAQKIRGTSIRHWR